MLVNWKELNPIKINVERYTGAEIKCKHTVWGKIVVNSTRE